MVIPSFSLFIRLCELKLFCILLLTIHRRDLFSVLRKGSILIVRSALRNASERQACAEVISCLEVAETDSVDFIVSQQAN